MEKEVYVVVVDTRGMNTSSIDAYKEHTWKNEYFERHVLSQPRVICAKSKVAELCGLHMKVYFHEYAHQSHARSLEVPPTVGIQDEEKEMWPRSIINNGASLLTFDPRTGFCDYRILGKAYVIVDGGDYPLSNHQVWGLQDLISEARDIYHCDPEHKDRGMKELLRFAKDYRHQNYEPLTIYKVRDVPWKVTDPSDNLSVKTVYIAEDHIHHHQIQDTGDPSFSRHLDHSYGKYGRVRLAGQPGEEELLETGKGKPNDAHKGRRIPKLFTACHVLD